MTEQPVHPPLKVLGLIPARGGSKGIPHKNIAPVAGRPLLAYTCEAALGSRWLSRVILSTDDPAIAEVGRAHGVAAPFIRPTELAGDDATSLAVAQHALRWLAEHDNWQADILVLLQPTSPLRRSHHIDEALDTLMNNNADTVVSVVPVPHHFSPYKLMQLEDGCLRNFWRDPLPFDPFNRHSLPTLYARNGPAVLASRAAVILDQNTFYGERVAPYVMNETDSIDIDTAFDLLLAEWLITRREADRTQGS
ncbi:MAG: acylneuraminate cytidylyltransferase family protein [Chloroflexi bacterium]|nr:acylneuraminate cytidylyltransferase family protein [Chloroflexota bacterium]